MDVRTDTNELTALAVKAAEDFGYEVEVNEAGLLSITWDFEGNCSDWCPPELIIACCRTNAYGRHLFDDKIWRKNIIAGEDARDAAREVEHRRLFGELVGDLVKAGHLDYAAKQIRKVDDDDLDLESVIREVEDYKTFFDLA